MFLHICFCYLLSGDSGAPGIMRWRQAAPSGCHKNSGESALWSCKSWSSAIQSNTPPETPSDKWQTGWWLVEKWKCQLALAKQIWSKLQACWGSTCAALASAGIQTLYCVRNSTCGTPAASTRKAWSIKEFLLASTNKSSSETQIGLYWIQMILGSTFLWPTSVRALMHLAVCIPVRSESFAGVFKREQSWTFRSRLP